MTCWAVVAFVILFVFQAISILTSRRGDSRSKTRRLTAVALWNLLWGAIAYWFCANDMHGHAWFVFLLPIFVFLYLIFFIYYMYYAADVRGLVTDAVHKIEDNVQQGNLVGALQSPIATARF